MRTAATDDALLLIVVGEKHKIGEGGDETQHYEALAAWAHDRFGVSDVRYRWSTHDLWPVDGLPYVGRLGSANHLLLVTGFGGWGMTNAAAAGLMLRDLIADRPSPWGAVFDPGRADLIRAAAPTVRHNFDVLVHWIGDRVERSQTEAGDIGMDEAAIVSVNGEHVAVHRDGAGIHAVSASCTHLGCTVRWNGAERTWDCPCHGSRFTPDGAVVSAPAVHPLPPRRFRED
jgi:Rieske Fe-S protein